MGCSTLGFPVHHNSWSLLKLMSIELLMPYNHLILCPPHLLHSIFPIIRVFSNESVLRIRWPKYWSFSFSISPPRDIQDWFPLGWTGLIFLQSKGLSRVFYNITVKSINSLVLSFLYGSILTSHMWYLYIVAYYSSIKRNAFDSVLMRWMNLEPIIQSEVSQKNKYHILMHIYGIHKDGTDRPIHCPSWLKIWYIGSCWWVVYAWRSVYIQSALYIHGSVDSSNFGLKNICEKFRKFSKNQNLNLLHTSNYLHSLYIDLGIVSNLEMILNIWKVCINYMKIPHHFTEGTWASTEFGNGWNPWNQSPVVSKEQRYR